MKTFSFTGTMIDTDEPCTRLDDAAALGALNHKAAAAALLVSNKLDKASI